MIEHPRVGVIYNYKPSWGPIKRVRVKGFTKGLVDTDGVDDTRHRSVSQKQLFAIE